MTVKELLEKLQDKPLTYQVCNIDETGKRWLVKEVLTDHENREVGFW